MKPTFSFNVYGIPAPGGSKTAFPVRGSKKINMVDACKYVGAWKNRVVIAARQAMAKSSLSFPLDGAILMIITHYVPRPKRPMNAFYPLSKPDNTKYLRATEDAISTAGVWKDDCRVIACLCGKEFATINGLVSPTGEAKCGAVIKIFLLDTEKFEYDVGLKISRRIRDGEERTSTVPKKGGTRNNPKSRK